MIDGLNIRCLLGGLEVVRSPHIEVHFRRRAVLSSASVDIPDVRNEVRGSVFPDDSAKISFSYRGAALAQTWEGTVARIEQIDVDTVRVHALGLEKKLLTSYITESFYQEMSQEIARRLLQASGLGIAEISIPQEKIPHAVFSHTTIARAVKQLAYTLHRSFGYDLRPYAVWLEESGLRWSDSFMPGMFRIASGENMLFHAPPSKKKTLGMVRSVLLPSLQHNQQVQIDDSRRGIRRTIIAQEVHHFLSLTGNTTTVVYGAEYGWG